MAGAGSQGLITHVHDSAESAKRKDARPRVAQGGLGVTAERQFAVLVLLLFFDHQRYLFNAGDGFQRFCVEHGVRMSRLESVMLTRSATAALGGLSGMLLSMVQEGPGGEVGSIMGGASRMAVFGPRGLRNFVSGARSYVGMRNLELAEGSRRGRPKE